MSISFNHTIVAAPRIVGSQRTTSPTSSACPAAKEFGPFLVVSIEHGASLDFAQTAEHQEIRPQHYVFLVTEPEFDEIYGRIPQRGRRHRADPGG